MPQQYSLECCRFCSNQDFEVENYTLKIHIDRDMLLTDLYDVRANLSEAALHSEDAKEAKIKLDAVINMIMNTPFSESQANLPKPRLRR